MYTYTLNCDIRYYSIQGNIGYKKKNNFIIREHHNLLTNTLCRFQSDGNISEDSEFYVL